MEQKFTTMAQEAVGDAIQSASAAGNAQVETLHVMDALLRQENGVARSLIEAAGGDPQAIGAAVRNALVALPSASGSSTSQPQASRQLTAAIAQAEKEMQQMGDEYVSTEHLLIGIAASKPNQSAEILEKNGVTAASLRKAVPGVRGGAKVTSPDAEGSYKALEKYSTDLTAAAKEGKLDPVIGRDQEIRRVIQILSRRTKNNPVLIGAFQSALGSTVWLIVAAVVAMYIVLGILYESFIHPITILSTLPTAGVGALLALLIAGSELDVIAIIGIILLIGIVKKNAIMMIDFALAAEREQGMSPREAIYQACLLRFRPILMTTLAALLGALPLMLSTGVGAELRRPLGIGMVGGLIVSQVLTLFTTPVIYLLFDRLALWTKSRFARHEEEA